MPATNAWDETKPAGSDLASTIDNQMRQMKLDIRERLALQHYWNVDVSTDGIHKEISVTPATTNAEILKTNSNQSITGTSATCGINLGITWNTGGAPKAIFVNVTNTASAAGARLIDLQVASSSKFSVDVSGNVTAAGSITTATIAYTQVNSVPTATVLGRTTAGTGAAEALTTLPAVNGSALTNLNATNIASGTVADARLSANVPLLNAANTFTSTGLQTLRGTLEIDAPWTSGIANGLLLAGWNAMGWDGSTTLTIGGSTAANWQTLKFYTAGTNWMTLSSAGVLTVSSIGSHTFTGGSNAGQSVVATNTTSGTGAYSTHELNAGTTAGGIYAFSQGYTTSGASIASSVLVFSGSTGGLTLAAADAAGVIRLYTGGSNLRWGINSAGDWTFGASSHIALSNGTPSISSGFGTSPSIAGTDYAMVITTGTGGPSGGVVNFGHTWSTTPICVCNVAENHGGCAVGPVSTTQATLNALNASAVTSGVKWFMLCMGY